MNRLIAILITFTLTSSVLAQDNLLIDCRILDADSKEPIDLVAVVIKHAQLGTISNADGFFSLEVPKDYADDTLYISILGYEPMLQPIVGMPGKENIIYLEKIYVEIIELVVQAKPAPFILEKALNKISKNFTDDEFISMGFFRQVHKENGSYVRLIEADVEVYSPGYEKRETTPYRDKLKVNEIRRSEVYERNGDIHGDHVMELLHQNAIQYAIGSVLYEVDEKNYEYFYNSTLPGYDYNEDVYGIGFKSIPKGDLKIEQGIIIVDRKTFGILHVDIQRYPNPNYNTLLTNGENKWRFVNGRVKLDFDWVGNKLYPNRLTWIYNHNVMNYLGTRADYVVEETFDMQFYGIKTQNLPEVDGKNGFHKLSNLYSMDYDYDADFWADYEPLKENPLSPKLLEDFNARKPLEEQFVVAGE